MNKRLFRMTYLQGQYKIEPISRTTTNLDTSKITSEVEKISSTAWVCMSKTKLVEFAEDHKAERIKQLQERLDLVQSGGVIFA